MARTTGILLLTLLTTFCTTKEESNRLSANLLPYFQDADVIIDTKFIDFGDPASQTYLDRKLETTRGQKGETLAFLKGRGDLRFTAVYPAERTFKIRCKLAEDATQNALLTPIVNGTRLEPAEVGPNFEDHNFVMPAEAIVPGTNQMTLQLRDRSGSGVQLDWISFEGATEPRSEFIQTSDGISVPVPSRIAIYLRAPEHSSLALDVGILSPSASGDVKVNVKVEREGTGREEPLISRSLRSGWFSRTARSENISLGQYGSQIVKLIMESLPSGSAKRPQRVYWKNIRLSFPAPALSEPQPRFRVSAHRPNIFFYLIDAMRADHVGAYGYRKSISPNIDRFAAESILFERAYTQAPWTRPAVASILTGLYPSTHGTRERIDMLAETVPTLQSMLRKSGYRLNSFSAQPNVGKSFGFQRSFDVYQLIADSHSNGVYEEFEKFVENGFKPPAFTYVHVIDTHRPYSPLPEFAPESGNCRAEQKISRTLAMNCAITLYDSLIRQSDHYFGLFLELLKKKGLYEESVIILTSDHGESFMEHGMFGHGKSVYEPEIRVPLLIRFPRSQFAGTKVSDVVQHIDLLPTILDLAGIPAPEHLEGASLLRLNKDRSEMRPIYSELSLDKQDDRALVLGDYKLIAMGSHSGPRYRLYNLADDPHERKDLRATDPVRFGYMRTLLNQWIRIQEKKTHRTKEAVLDPQTEEQLKALGYLQ